MKNSEKKLFKFLLQFTQSLVIIKTVDIWLFLDFNVKNNCHLFLETIGFNKKL